MEIRGVLAFVNMMVAVAMMSGRASGYQCFIDGICQESKSGEDKGCLGVKHREDYYRSSSSEICRREFFQEDSCVKREEGNWRRIQRSREFQDLLNAKEWKSTDPIEVCCCWSDCCNRKTDSYPMFKARQGSDQQPQTEEENDGGKMNPAMIAGMASGMGLVVLVVGGILGAVITSRRKALKHKRSRNIPQPDSESLNPKIGSFSAPREPRQKKRNAVSDEENGMENPREESVILEETDKEESDIVEEERRNQENKDSSLPIQDNQLQ